MERPARPSSDTVPAAHAEPWTDRLARYGYRLAAGGFLPAEWFHTPPPPVSERAASTGRLKLEVVSHCWNYAHLLIYQLSSLVLNPPRSLDVRMTVFHALEDQRTVALLRHFSERRIPGVEWNWQVLEPQRLMRRAIGRNLAAKATPADWIWFTDCDLLFGEGCLDALAAALQGRRDALVYPRQEACTSLLPADHALLQSDFATPSLVRPAEAFTRREINRATGPLQITHGDVARAIGYCDEIACYQKPAFHWRKTYEDRTFRWLLGTQGTPIDVPGVFRIRHVDKGRYSEHRGLTGIRKWTRRLRETLLRY